MIILLVEDEPFTAMDLVTALDADGHQVIGPTATIAEALDVAGVTMPDLILMDVNLPDGSGLDAARELYRRHGCRSVFISGSIDDGHPIDDTAIGFLAKPFETEAVLQAMGVVEAVLEGRPCGDLPRQLTLYPASDGEDR